MLWCSEKTNSGSSNIIDCGGGTNDVEEYQLQAVWSDSLKEPIINAPGIYNRDMCIELEVCLYVLCRSLNTTQYNSNTLLCCCVYRDM